MFSQTLSGRRRQARGRRAQGAGEALLSRRPGQDGRAGASLAGLRTVGRRGNGAADDKSRPGEAAVPQRGGRGAGASGYGKDGTDRADGPPKSAGRSGNDRAGPNAAGLPIFVSACGPGAWMLRVAVTPGGAKDALAGLAEDRLRVRLRAKAVEGRANAALTMFLAACLGLKTRQVVIVSGDKSRKKTIRIEAESEPDWSRATGTG
jgi:uncharacterized protein (TIGR00251 family)